MKKQKLVITIDVLVNDLAAEGEGTIAGVKKTDGTFYYGYDYNTIGQNQDYMKDIGTKIVNDISDKLKIDKDKIRFIL